MQIQLPSGLPKPEDVTKSVSIDQLKKELEELKTQVEKDKLRKQLEELITGHKPESY
jgi:hypothetical protein